MNINMILKKNALASTVFQHNVPLASLWENKFKFKGKKKVERNFANKPM